MDLSNTKFKANDISDDSLIPVCINVINRTFKYCGTTNDNPGTEFTEILRGIAGNRNSKKLKVNPDEIFNAVIRWSEVRMLEYDTSRRDSDGNTK